MKIKTKSGFECNINERRLTDWRYIKAAAKMNEGNESEIAVQLAFAVPFLLEEEGEKALMEFIEDKNGIIDSNRLIAEFIEITQIAGEKVKKSQSSLSS
jgi:hypothetical protein